MEEDGAPERKRRRRSWTPLCQSVHVAISDEDEPPSSAVRTAAQRWCRENGLVVGDFRSPRKVADGSDTCSWITAGTCYKHTKCFEGDGRLWQFVGKPTDDGRVRLSIKQHGEHSGEDRLARKARSEEATQKQPTVEQRAKAIAAIDHLRSQGIKPTATSVALQLKDTYDADVLRALIRSQTKTYGNSTAAMIESEATFRSWVSESLDKSLLKIEECLV